MLMNDCNIGWETLLLFFMYSVVALIDTLMTSDWIFFVYFEKVIFGTTYFAHIIQKGEDNDRVKEIPDTCLFACCSIFWKVV